MQDAIQIVWFKRDLRLTDHKPLCDAAQSPCPTLLIYIFEDILLDDAHYSERHWRFVSQSLGDLNHTLANYNTHIHIFKGDVLRVFKTLSERFEIKRILSYQEVGIQATFTRDLAIQGWCQQHKIEWKESQSGAVIRGLTTRKYWTPQWYRVMENSLDTPDLTTIHFLPTDLCTFETFDIPQTWLTKQKGFQTGGPTLAWKTLEDFFVSRGRNYAYAISKPAQSRTSCSRISPYLAWGNISLREVYQFQKRFSGRAGWTRTLSAFASRLHWHCHFIQKFESECAIEVRSLNAGYLDFPYRDDANVTRDYLAWQQGNTGVPLVDACMRSLIHTGYINFRMRAMLVSFLTHHLNISWEVGVAYLASLFLDFEPGIHYAQFHMQAGITGINTIRIYNPTKQAIEHDPEGAFIKRWLPQLTNIPAPLCATPWLLSSLEQQMYNLPADSIYLNPIIDLEASGKEARDRLWSWRKRKEVKQEVQRILYRHVAKAAKPSTTHRK